MLCHVECRNRAQGIWFVLDHAWGAARQQCLLASFLGVRACLKQGRYILERLL